MSNWQAYRNRPIRLSRRSLLRGAGAAIGLPLLEAMLPVGRNAFAQGAVPTRMIAYYMPCGMNMRTWTPSTAGSDYTLSETLEPLAALKDDILVLSGIANRPAKPPGGVGDHATGTGAFITATSVRKTEGADILNGISMDQMAAKVIGQSTPLPSLELGIEGGGSAGECDFGYSCAYARNISWVGPQTPLPKLVDPRRVFDRLFTGMSTDSSAAETEQRWARNKSVLDLVLADVQKLNSRLGSQDRAKLDEYLTALNQLEKKLSAQPAASCSIPSRPAEDLEIDDHVEVMADLMTVAFQCDMTRVQTFMLGNAASTRSYSFIGIDQTHHEVSHHQSLQSALDKLTAINKWEISKFAYLLERLKSTEDVTGTNLLDSSAIFLSSEMSDPNQHSHADMPVILAGRANGYFNTGRHVVYEKEVPMSNLFISMLDAVGAPVSSFGDDSTGPLQGLT